MDVFTTSTTALVSQVGGRHLSFQFTNAQQKLLQHPYGQLFILYAMFYISTRSLMVSAVLIAFYLILVNVLLNENHPLNILSREWLRKEGFLSKDAPSRTEMYKANLANLDKNYTLEHLKRRLIGANSSRDCGFTHGKIN